MAALHRENTWLVGQVQGLQQDNDTLREEAASIKQWAWQEASNAMRAECEAFFADLKRHASIMESRALSAEKLTTELHQRAMAAEQQV